MSISISSRPPRFVFLATSATDHPHGEARFAWRLVAANHRPLGRDLRSYPSLHQSRDAALSVQRAVVSGLPAVAVDALRGKWAWRVVLEGEPVAVSTRQYARRVECLRAVEQFVAAVKTADPEDGVVRYYGQQALQAFAPAGDVEGQRR